MTDPCRLCPICGCLDRPILTPADVAAALGVTRRTVYGWIHSDVIPAHRIGRLWFLHHVDLHGALRSRRSVFAPYAPDLHACA